MTAIQELKNAQAKISKETDACLKGNQLSEQARDVVSAGKFDFDAAFRGQACATEVLKKAGKELYEAKDPRAKGVGAKVLSNTQYLELHNNVELVKLATREEHIKNKFSLRNPIDALYNSLSGLFGKSSEQTEIDANRAYTSTKTGSEVRKSIDEAQTAIGKAIVESAEVDDSIRRNVDRVNFESSKAARTIREIQSKATNDALKLFESERKK